MKENGEMSTPDAKDARLVITGRNKIHAAALEVVQLARRELVIYSNQLADRLFSRNDFLEAVRTLAIATPQTEVRILVRKPGSVVGNAPQLLELCKVLSSKIKIRAIAAEHRSRQVTFIIADDRAVIYHPSPESDAAVIEKVPATAKHYRGVFQSMWDAGRSEPDFRALNI